MTHPIVPLEIDFLMNDDMGVLLQSIEAGNFTRLGLVASTVLPASPIIKQAPNSKEQSTLRSSSVVKL